MSSGHISLVILIAILVASSFAAACQSASPKAQTVRGDRSPPNARAEPAPAPVEPARVRPHFAGVGHQSDIHAVFPAPERAAALTLDRLGSMRFWADLDGRWEPIIVPVPQVQTAALASAGESFFAAAIDNVGVTHMIDIRPTPRMAPGFVMTRTGTLGPDVAALDAVVLPDRRVAVVAGDHSVHLYDRMGHLLSSYQQPSTRFVQVRRAGERLVAMTVQTTSAMGEERPHTALGLHRLAIDKRGHLRSLGARSDIVVAGDRVTWPLRVAVAPDARKVLYLSRAPSGQPVLALRILGAKESQTAPLQLATDWMAQTWHLGFVDGRTGFLTAPYIDRARIIRIAAPTAPNAESDADATSPGITVHPTSPTGYTLTGQPGFALGRYLSGHDGSLLVHSVADDDTHYLGYREFAPIVADVSSRGTDGRSWVAWGGDSILVEPVSTGTGRAPQSGALLEFARGATDRGYELFFTATGRLLHIAPTGLLQLMNWRTGKVDAQRQVDDGVRTISFDRRADTVRVGGHGEAHTFAVDGAHLLPLTDSETPARERKALTPGLVTETDGRHLVIRNPGGSDALRLPRSEVKLVAPSPDGARMLVLLGNSALLVIERASLTASWRFDAGAPVRFARWSPDSDTLVVLTTDFGAVYDAVAKRRLQRRCGGVFTVSKHPLRTAFRSRSARSSWQCR